MKYLVLKQLGIERKLKTSHDSTLVAKDDIQSNIFSRHAKKTRRFRSAFTTEQIKYLEKEFKKFPYIGSGNRKEVSSILNIPERAVKIWFQNRRMKEKKDVTHKEIVDEEQKKMYIARQGQTNIKTFNHMSHCTKPHAACQSEFKTIYPDPSITKASIKHVSGTNLCASHASDKSIPDQQRATEKTCNNINFTNTNNTRIVNKVVPVASPQFNKKSYVPMKMSQNKNICITKLLKQEQLVNQKLGHGKVKLENLTDSTPEAQSLPHVIQPNFYQVNPNQDQRYMPLHVQTLPQPPPFVPGNMLWKQVNVIPVLPGIATPPSHVTNNSFSLMHPNFPKDDCKCNCNPYNPSQDMAPLMQVEGRLHLQSQYILAMPFNNHFEKI